MDDDPIYPSAMSGSGTEAEEHVPFAKALELGRLSDRGGPCPRAVAEPTL